MKGRVLGVVGVLMTAALGAATLEAAWAQAGRERPLWAYPTLAAVEPRSPHPPLVGPQQLPGSAKRYTLQEAELAVSAADWFPERHAPMPKIVRDGTTNGGFACASCHMPSGFGHAESASLVGLTPAYFIKTMKEYRSGERQDPIRMNGIARATSDAEIAEAAAWFATLKTDRLPWTKVVEAATVPKTYIGSGRMRFIDPDARGATEPIGARIIEVPEDAARMRLHDPAAAFIAYVPPGAIARGKALAETGAGKTLPCAACHGARLEGLGDIPPIAGNHPLFIARQLFDFQVGARNGPDAQQMKPVVERLTDADIVDLAAYIGSLRF